MRQVQGAAMVLVDVVVVEKKKDGMRQAQGNRQTSRGKRRSTWSVRIPALSLHLHVKACLSFLYISLPRS